VIIALVGVVVVAGLLLVKVDIVLLDMDDGLAEETECLSHELRRDLVCKDAVNTMLMRKGERPTSFVQFALAIASLRRIILSN
jgi:hypothetical protein